MTPDDEPQKSPFTYESLPGGDGLDELQPSREERVSAEALFDLTGAQQAADQVQAEVIASVGDPLAGAEAIANSTIDELLGQVSADLNAQSDALNKFLNKQFTDAQKQLTNAGADLKRVGVYLPFTPGEMQSAVDGDWLQLIVNAVPTMGAAIGVAPTSPPPPAFGYDAPVGYGDTGSPTIPGYVAPGTGPRLDPDKPEDWDRFRTQALAGIDAEFAAMGPATATATAEAMGPDGKCCGCGDVTVNVTVPPIVAQMPAGFTSLLESFQNRDPFQIPTVPAPIPGVSPPRPGAPPPAVVPQPAPAPAPAAPVGVPQLWDVPPTSPGAQPSALLFPHITGFGLASTIQGLNWNDAGACAVAAELAKNPNQNQPAPPPPPVTTDPFETMVRSRLSYIDPAKIFVSALSPLATVRDVWNKSTDGQIKSVEAWVGKAVEELGLNQLSPQSVPNKAAALYFGGRLAIADRAELVSGFPLRYLYQADEYALNWSNPQMLPGQVRIDAAFLSNQITSEEWVCWTRALGNLPEPARKIMLADQNKPGVRELIELHMRGHLKKEDLLKRGRELGVLDPMYLVEWSALMRALPTQSDLIRFMVRDAADKDVVEKFSYDLGFKEKFVGPMKKWADALGLDEEYFRFQWRAHWNTPSFTQLGEMLARLRPDRPEMEEFDAKLAGVEPNLQNLAEANRPLFVTPADVAEALQVDDMAPGWVPKLMEISTNPINRTDAVRAFMIGAFDEKRLYHAFRDVQYSERDAKTLVEFYKQDKARRNRNLSGTWSIRKTLGYFKKAAITREEARVQLRPMFPSEKAVDETLDAAELEIAAEVKQTQLRGLRRGYMFGEFTRSAAIQLMRQWGMDATQADRTLLVWEVERDSRFKQPTVAMLTKWHKNGVIDVEEFRRRLVNLGYKLVDADRIVAAALKLDFADGPPTEEELSATIAESIKSQKEARRQNDTWLARQVKALEASIRRVRAEQFRRLDQEGRNQWNPLTIP